MFIGCLRSCVLGFGTRICSLTSRLRGNSKAPRVENQAKDNGQVSKVEAYTNKKGQLVAAGQIENVTSKPRAKKTQIQEAPVEETYEPSSPKRTLKLPTDPSTSEVAAAMLKLLQDQSCSRQSRKQRLYSSWFQ